MTDSTTPRRMSPARLASQFFRDLPHHARKTLAIRIASVGLEFLCLLVLARFLDAAAYGTYALAMSLVAIFAVPAAFGLDRLVVRELAACQAIADFEHAHGILRHSLLIVICASLIAAAATGIAGKLVLRPVGQDATFALLLAAALVPLVALARLRQAALQGLGHVAAGLAPEFLIQPAIVILLAAVVAMATLTGAAPR